MSKEEYHPKLEKKKIEFVPIFMRVSLMGFALTSIIVFKCSLAQKKPSRPQITIPASR